MKLRTQWILAFLLLAVVPLGAITIYSYVSSARALRRTVESEASRLAEDLNDRMAVVTANLTRRIDSLETLTFPDESLPAGSHGESQDPVLIGKMFAALGEAADLIDSFEYTPVPEPPAPPHPQEVVGADARVHRPRMAGGPTVKPVVIRMPRMVGELAKNPKLAPMLKFATEILPAADADKVRKDLEENLGQNTQEILRVVKEKVLAEVEARRQEKEKREAPPAVFDLSQEFGCQLKRNGQTVGHLKAKVSTDRLLGEVLSQTRREQGEIPFAIDASGNLFTPNPADGPTLRGLELAVKSGKAGAVPERATPAAAGEAPAKMETSYGGDHRMRVDVKPNENWVVVTREAPAAGLVFGIARPVGAALGEVRRASARNLGAGLALAVMALFAVVPISRRMTHNLSDLTRAAGEVAAGRLDVQVPVRSRDELGQLAQTFNRMARDLAANQERLVEQERLRKELELCRRIQTELLPKKPLTFPFAEMQGLSIPAHELGGDFFNYFSLPGGEVALFMGDVSGKGVPAALLMANLQATLRARIPLEPDLAEFARRLDREVEGSTPPEVYLTLFLGVLDPRRHELRYVNAGHESPFLLRSGGRAERLESTGRPIGLLAGGDFQERRVSLESGDRLLLYTDGLLDAENESGSEFGPDRLERLLAIDVAGDPASLLARIERAYQEHRGAREAADDATLLVLRVGSWLHAGQETVPRSVMPRPPEPPPVVTV